MKLFIQSITLLVFVFSSSIPSFSSSHAGKKDIVDTAVSAGSFSTLAAALQAANLIDVLKGDGPFTVFAPSDEAFAKIPKEALDALLKDKEALTAVLTYHVVPGKVMANEVVKTKSAKTVNGQELVITTEGETVTIDGVNVIKTDIVCSNGVIHVVDSVIMPKDIVERASIIDDFSTLVAAVKAAGLVDVLKSDGAFTLFAPTNEAFAALPEGTVENLLKPENIEKLKSILTYHVVPGKVLAEDVIKVTKAKTVQGQELKVKVDEKTVYINDAKVMKTDVLTNNGVIHVIDSVLLPSDM